MSLHVLIPARAGSTGVPDKNIRSLAGGPSLIERAVAVATDLQPDSITVSTDYPEDRLPWSCRPYHLDRPARYATATASMSDVVIHWTSSHRLADDDTVVLLQPTSLHPDRAVLIRHAQPLLPPVISVDVYPDRWHPFYALVPLAPVTHTLPACRQDLPLRFRANGLYYLLSGVEAKRGRIWSPPPTYVVTPGSVINIDTPEDWAEAERVWRCHG